MFLLGVSLDLLIGGGLVLLVLAAVSPPARRFFRSIGSAFGAQLDNAAENVANVDPLAQYKSQINNALEKAKNAQRVVQKAGQTLASLNRQVADDLKQQERLTARIQAVVASGDPNKTAEQYAMDLEHVESSLSSNQEQLKSAQTIYDENLALVQRFETEINNARKDAAKLGFELQQSAAEKDLYEVSAALKANLDTGDLAVSRQRVQSQIDANRGAAKASHDLASSSYAQDADDELERKNRANAILARFQKPESVASNHQG